MTTQEFSNSFTVLLNSFALANNFGEEASKQTVTLDEYEKSVFLTKAQEELVFSLYNGRNPLGESFEETEELRRYLSNLVVEDHPEQTSCGDMIGVSPKSTFYQLNDDVWFITYEAITVKGGGGCHDGSVLDVIPVTQDEYHRIKRNPFRGFNSRRALRLDLADNVVEIVSQYSVKDYYIRYVRKLKPIILEDLTKDGLSIEGETSVTECELHQALHRMILERAVNLALQTRGIYDNTNKNN